ncbi:MAG: penicillin-binding protein activator LpoB [Spirochaetes bacterium]|nr:penicillin-binding protein activator LpoB [Spirochaetota bacterium]
MRKKLLALSFFAVLVAVLAGCSSAPRVTRVEAGGATSDLSGFWSAADVRIVSESLIADALSSPRLDAYIRELAVRNGAANPTVIVGRFRNNSSEHIDTAIISSNMRTAIINSGRLDFVEGGDARDDIRAERQDQQWNASEATAAALGNETGADFMLTGDVRTIVDRAGNMMVRTYFVTATITCIETNRIIWEGENNTVQKLIQRPRARL